MKVEAKKGAKRDDVDLPNLLKKESTRDLNRIGTELFEVTRSPALNRLEEKKRKRRQDKFCRSRKRTDEKRDQAGAQKGARHAELDYLKLRARFLHIH